MPNIPEYPMPMRSSAAQPGGLHTAQIEYGPAQQTQALWYRACGNRFGYHWPHPDVAPRWSEFSINTWSSFDFDETTDTYTLSLPWTVQKHAEQINAVLWIAVSKPEPVQIRMKSDDLISVVAAATGAGGQPTAAYLATAAPPGNWQLEGPEYFYRTSCSLTPTLPADRRVALTFEAQNILASGDYRTERTTVQIYIHSCLIWDVFPPIGS